MILHRHNRDDEVINAHGEAKVVYWAPQLIGPPNDWPIIGGPPNDTNDGYQWWILGMRISWQSFAAEQVNHWGAQLIGPPNDLSIIGGPNDTNDE